MVLVVAILLWVVCAGCGNVPEIDLIFRLKPADPAFYNTMAAQLDAPILGGNRLEILLNGQQIFPEMLAAIAGARAVLGGERYFPALAAGKSDAQAVKSSPLTGSYDTYLLYLMSIAAARKSIHITNPCFLPSDRLTQALLAAASRGVEVVLLTPGVTDWRLVYRASRRGFGPLLLGGVKLYEYQPALMNAKTMVVDDAIAVIGSTNLDNRSFALNEEINLVAYDSATARRLDEVFAEDLTHAKRVEYAAWKARPLGEKILELFTLPIEEEL
jgi:cardiolipin synthase